MVFWPQVARAFCHRGDNRLTAQTFTDSPNRKEQKRTDLTGAPIWRS